MSESSVPADVPAPGAGDLPHVDVTVDARGLNCPLPILKAKKALAGMASGQVLRIEATDPGSKQDFSAFCRQTGNPLLAQIDEEAVSVFFVQRR
ncbi:MAG: sulfurtransferase TusA family protein [Lautropia sp.]|nr:sulfurtransferase TusA family protein [Lautropia sp.]